MAKKSFIQRMRDLFSPKTTPSVRANKVSLYIRNVPKNIPLAGGGRLVNARSESAALSSIINNIEGRLQVTVTDVDGNMHEIYTGGRVNRPNGISAKYLLDEMERRGLGLDEILSDHYSDNQYSDNSEIGAIALYTVRVL